MQPLAHVSQSCGVPESGLAKVILLQPVRRGGVDRSPDVDHLEARYGVRWTCLPADMGRDGLYAERLIAAAPTALDAGTVAPDAAAVTIRELIPSVSAAIELVREGVELLGEVLGTSLEDVPFAQLRHIAVAAIAVGSGPTPEPAWADPHAAALADAVLGIHGPLLDSSRQLHESVYAAFTDLVWDVPVWKLGRRRAAWPIVGVRRKLAAASRTGKAPRMRDALGLLLEATAARAAIASVQPLLTIHLGAFDRGPMTDAAQAADALVAVTELQAALGDRLDTARLDGLLRADAFTVREVVEPARTVQMVADAWSADAAKAGVTGAPGVTVAGLARWLEDAPIAADLFEEGAAAAARAGQPAATVQGLVNDLLACQRASEARARNVPVYETARRSS